jgi:hypothetical protein
MLYEPSPFLFIVPEIVPAMPTFGSGSSLAIRPFLAGRGSLLPYERHKVIERCAVVKAHVNHRVQARQVPAVGDRLGLPFVDEPGDFAKQCISVRRLDEKVYSSNDALVGHCDLQMSSIWLRAIG